MENKQLGCDPHILTPRLMIHSNEHTHTRLRTHFFLTHYFGLGVSLTLMELYEIFKPLLSSAVCVCVHVSECARACVCIT